MSNVLKTGLLLGVLTALFVLGGRAIAGEQGMIIGFVVAALMNFFSYWFSDKIVLAMYGAQPVDEAQAPGLHAMVRRLATRAQIPMPRIYVIPSDTPNAFATGRNPQHAAVAVTEGTMRILDEDELEGVLAHELSHVTNRDILVGTIAAGIAMSITFIARMAFWFGGGDDRDNPLGAFGFIFALILAPLAAMLIQLAVSRSREYQADESGAHLSHDPLALASALRKIEAAAKQVPPVPTVTPAQAHMFIVNPFTGRKIQFANLFSTHPPTEQRIARLEHMAQQGV
jgi:heat shock protein HtpX